MRPGLVIALRNFYSEPTKHIREVKLSASREGSSTHGNFFISLSSCPWPCYKVQVAGVLSGEVEREPNLNSALCVFSLRWTRKLWPCSSSWKYKISVTHLKDCSGALQNAVKAGFDPAVLKGWNQDLPCWLYVTGKNPILSSHRPWGGKLVMVSLGYIDLHLSNMFSALWFLAF